MDELQLPTWKFVTTRYALLTDTQIIVYMRDYCSELICKECEWSEVVEVPWGDDLQLAELHYLQHHWEQQLPEGSDEASVFDLINLAYHLSQKEE